MTAQEQRLVCYDYELKIEAHQFNGIMPVSRSMTSCLIGEVSISVKR